VEDWCSYPFFGADAGAVEGLRSRRLRSFHTVLGQMALPVTALKFGIFGCCCGESVVIYVVNINTFGILVEFR
jgi:hypothetical protein